MAATLTVRICPLPADVPAEQVPDVVTLLGVLFPGVAAGGVKELHFWKQAAAPHKATVVYEDDVSVSEYNTLAAAGATLTVLEIEEV